MLSEEQNLKHISTGCEDLDKILGGGKHCKEVTEVGGVPGIGKTQLGIQLAVNVQIPVDYGGLSGKAIYIDTEGSFMVKRAYQIAEACIRDTLNSFVHHRKNIQGLQERMQPNNFLSNIFYFRICSYTEQIAVLNYLNKFLAEHKDVKIVIIDSVTFHFRQDFDDLAPRTRVLGGTSLQLMKLAKRFSVAVIHGRMPAPIELFCIGTIMSVMHTSTNLHLFDQPQQLSASLQKESRILLTIPQTAASMSE